MTGSKKNIVTMLLAVFILIPMLCTTVHAASEKYSIDMDMQDAEYKEAYDAQIYLYKVADAMVDADGNLHMEPVEFYQDVTFDGLHQSEVHQLLDTLCGRLHYPGAAEENMQNLEPVAVQKSGSDGQIHFRNLDAGVYLVMKWDSEAPSQLEMSPSLVYLPWYHQESDTWEHTARVVPKFSWQSDVTPDPEPIPTPEPTTPDGTLPQTGMMQWPVPVLVLAGLFLLGIGYGMVRRAKQD